MQEDVKAPYLKCDNSELSRAIYGHYGRQLNNYEQEKLIKDTSVLSDYKQKKLEVEAKKNWDLFYKRNENRFFKDRHWTKREFYELTGDSISKYKEGKPVLLEVGCGVGNFIFPLIEEKSEFFIYACDFSPRAINLLKEHPLYNEDVCNAFVCDLTEEQQLTTAVQANSVHIASMIFVLSAIHPDKMKIALQNIYNVLCPEGILLFRDYGLFDEAMLRFGRGHKLSENFYVRQDGTRAFYFSEEYLQQLIEDVGFQVIENRYIIKETVNHKKNISVPRIYLQGRYMKV